MLKVNVKKKLPSIELDAEFFINEHDFVALTGKSGSGKTTLLRIIAGLEDANGEISFFGKTWLDNKNILAVQKRGIGFVFQDYALFENMNVEQNLLYVKNDYELASHLLKMTELNEFKNRMPKNLSGGQKQRVALCRALMSRPRLLLLDEPLSALDIDMRKKLQQDILNFKAEFGITTIMVSHDSSEIYRLSSRVIVLEDGKIIKEIEPKDLLLKDLALIKQELDINGYI